MATYLFLPNMVFSLPPEFPRAGKQAAGHEQQCYETWGSLWATSVVSPHGGAQGSGHGFVLVWGNWPTSTKAVTSLPQLPWQCRKVGRGWRFVYFQGPASTLCMQLVLKAVR